MDWVRDLFAKIIELMQIDISCMGYSFSLWDVLIFDVVMCFLAFTCYVIFDLRGD